jgi:hypothetical protein
VLYLGDRCSIFMAGIFTNKKDGMFTWLCGSDAAAEVQLRDQDAAFGFGILVDIRDTTNQKVRALYIDLVAFVPQLRQVRTKTDQSV